MKLIINKIYIILFSLFVFLAQIESEAKNNNIKYKKENISNYFSGIISVKQDNNNTAFNYLKKVKLLKNTHSKFNINYIRTLVLLEKFEEAFDYSKSVWSEDELFFEGDLLLGLDFYIKKDYQNADKHFKRLNKISRYNLFFDNFIGNVLLAWSKASQKEQKQGLLYFEKIPKTYQNLKKIQKIFYKCYFDENETQKLFEGLIQNRNYNFSRYNFFLANYLLHQNRQKFF